MRSLPQSASDLWASGRWSGLVEVEVGLACAWSTETRVLQAAYEFDTPRMSRLTRVYYRASGTVASVEVSVLQGSQWSEWYDVTDGDYSSVPAGSRVRVRLGGTGTAVYCLVEWRTDLSLPPPEQIGPLTAELEGRGPLSVRHGNVSLGYRLSLSQWAAAQAVLSDLTGLTVGVRVSEAIVGARLVLFDGRVASWSSTLDESGATLMLDCTDRLSVLRSIRAEEVFAHYDQQGTLVWRTAVSQDEVVAACLDRAGVVDRSAVSPCGALVSGTLVRHDDGQVPSGEVALWAVHHGLGARVWSRSGTTVRRYDWDGVSRSGGQAVLVPSGTATLSGEYLDYLVRAQPDGTLLCRHQSTARYWRWLTPGEVDLDLRSVLPGYEITKAALVSRDHIPYALATRQATSPASPYGGEVDRHYWRLAYYRDGEWVVYRQGDVYYAAGSLRHTSPWEWGWMVGYADTPRGRTRDYRPLLGWAYSVGSTVTVVLVGETLPTADPQSLLAQWSVSLPHAPTSAIYLQPLHGWHGWRDSLSGEWRIYAPIEYFVGITAYRAHIEIGPSGAALVADPMPLPAGILSALPAQTDESAPPHGRYRVLRGWDLSVLDSGAPADYWSLYASGSVVYWSSRLGRWWGRVRPDVPAVATTAVFSGRSLWEVLCSLAWGNGYRLYQDGDRVVFGPASGGGGVALDESRILSVGEARVDESRLVNRLTVTYGQAGTQRTYVDAQSYQRYGPRDADLEARWIESQSWVDQVAHAWLDRYRWPTVTVSVTAHYSPHIEVGDTVSIQVLPSLDDDTAVVERVTHDLSARRTTLSLRLSVAPDMLVYGISEYGG